MNDDIKHEDMHLRKGNPHKQPSFFRRNLSFLPIIILFTGLGCAIIPQQAAAPVAPTILPPAPLATPEICSEKTPALSIQVLFGRKVEHGQHITINGVGFIPGERITLRETGQNGANTYTIEAKDYLVQEDGTFSYDTTLPLDLPNMLWEARAIHQRGIACLRFKAPG